MDLSAVIFAAVAVAWAVYLVPKAIRHHDEADSSRSVERFSHTVRVLARRDAVSARDARLVVPERAAAPAPGHAEGDRRPEPARGTEPQPERSVVRRAPTLAELRARRLAARRATRRRRRVLGVLLAANAVVGGLALAGVVAGPWVAAPAATLVAWLVTCRLMVRREHAVWVEMTAPTATDAAEPREAPLPEPQVTGGADAGDADEQTDDHAAVPAGDDEDDEDDRAAGGHRLTPAETTAQSVAPDGRRLWDPVPVTLPTYVHKATAVRRSVRTIDLDATGVWTSGRTDEDARIAQATARRVAREAGEADGEGGRAVGS